MAKGKIKRLVTDRGYGFIQTKKGKTSSSIRVSFKVWAILLSRKAKR